MTTLFIVIAGYILLELIFAAVRSDWPENYYTVDNSSTSDFAHSANPIAYLLFRYLPLTLVTILMVTVADRSGVSNPRLAGSYPALLHTFYHVVIGLDEAARRQRGSRKGPLILLRLGSGVGALAVTIIASLTSTRFATLVPEVEILVTELWTALFVALAVVTLQRATSRSVDVFDRAILRSAGRIDETIFRCCYEQSLANSISPEILFTIVVVENLQRPSWFRYLENRLGWLLPNRTTGIAQVIHHKPLSDQESIAMAAETKLRGAQFAMDRHGYPDMVSLRAAFVRHNPADSYAETCCRAYWVLSANLTGSGYLGQKLRELGHTRLMGEDIP